MSAEEAFKRDVILGLWLLRLSLKATAARHGVGVGEKLLDLIRELSNRDWLEFEAGALSLGNRHRFSAGRVMECLASLGTQHWTQTEELAGLRPITIEPMSLVDRTSKLNTVIRMARRDPQFFKAISKNPEGVLESLGYDLTEPDVMEFISTVAHRQPVLQTRSADREFEKVWKAVQNEHVTLGSEN